MVRLAPVSAMKRSSSMPSGILVDFSAFASITLVVGSDTRTPHKDALEATSARGSGLAFSANVGSPSRQDRPFMVDVVATQMAYICNVTVKNNLSVNDFTLHARNMVHATNGYFIKSHLSLLVKSARVRDLILCGNFRPRVFTRNPNS
jgi:hypothetical protein